MKKVTHKKQLPTPDVLRSRLRYEPETGKLFWRECAGMPRRWNARWAGKEAFTSVSSNGYHVGAFNYANFHAHRVIWVMVYGQWPTEDIDHIDGNRANNRVENLRAVSRSVNMRNAYRRKDNKSGFVGVHKNRVGSWVAQIAVDGRVIHLGSFRAQGDAVAARKAAEIEHGFSVRHGCEAI